MFMLLWLTYAYISNEQGAFSTYAGFSVMARVAKETTWASFTGGIGTLGLCAVAWQNSLLRMTWAAMACAFFLMVAACVTVAVPNGTGTGAYLCFAILAATLAYREAHEYSNPS